MIMNEETRKQVIDRMHTAIFNEIAQIEDGVDLGEVHSCIMESAVMSISILAGMHGQDAIDAVKQAMSMYYGK